jgi:hypothetical protein
VCVCGGRWRDRRREIKRERERDEERNIMPGTSVTRMAAGAPVVLRVTEATMWLLAS